MIPSDGCFLSLLLFWWMMSLSMKSRKFVTLGFLETVCSFLFIGRVIPLVTSLGKMLILFMHLFWSADFSGFFLVNPGLRGDLLSCRVSARGSPIHLLGMPWYSAVFHDFLCGVSGAPRYRAVYRRSVPRY